jgi:hypothetical protein
MDAVMVFALACSSLRVRCPTRHISDPYSDPLVERLDELLSNAAAARTFQFVDIQLAKVCHCEYPCLWPGSFPPAAQGYTGVRLPPCCTSHRHHTSKGATARQWSCRASTGPDGSVENSDRYRPRRIDDGGDGNEISVLLASNRLQITADVDDKGLEKLEQMLAKYKEILKMLQ